MQRILKFQGPDGIIEMPWDKPVDPTDEEIDAFIANKPKVLPPSQTTSPPKPTSDLKPVTKVTPESPKAPDVKDPHSSSGSPSAGGPARGLFESVLPESNRNYTPETLPSFPVRAAKEVLYEGLLRPAMSAGGQALTGLTEAGGMSYGPAIKGLISKIPYINKPLSKAAPATEAAVTPPVTPSVTPPVTEPASPGVAFDKVMGSQSIPKPLTGPDLINAEAVKQTIKSKPRVKAVGGDLKNIELINPTKEHVEGMLQKGYSVTGTSPSGSIKMELTGPALKDVTPINATTTFAKTASPKVPKVASLPKDLAGASPRWHAGQKVYLPLFDNDLDKAAYIIAKVNPSKRDADYLRFVMENTGLDEVGARNYGFKVKNAIKQAVRGQPEGAIKLPKVGHELSPPPALGGPNFPGGGNGGIPPTGTVPPVPGSPEPNPSSMNFVDTLKHQIKEKGVLTTIGNFQRGSMSGIDLSPGFRQGAFLVGRKEFWKSFKPMIKAAMKEGNYQAMNEEISGRANSELYKEGGLHLTDLADGMGNREEAIMSNLPELLPGIGRAYRGSNRAYTAFLNKLRADMFDSLLTDATSVKGIMSGGGREVNEDLVRKIANYVNTSTGRGDLGRLTKHAELLNAVAFSPRLIASRLQLLNPKLYVAGDPFIRKQAIRDGLSFLSFGSSLLGLGKLAGAEVELDPHSADFGKMKIGNTRMSVFGGVELYPRLLAQLAPQVLGGGYIKSSTTGKITDLTAGKFGRSTRLDVAHRALEAKEAPMLSLLTDMARGKSFSGAPVNTPTGLTKEVVSRFVPMILQDLKDILTDDPKKLPLLVPAAFGFGVQTYGGYQYPKTHSPYSVPRNR